MTPRSNVSGTSRLAILYHLTMVGFTIAAFDYVMHESVIAFQPANSAAAHDADKAAVSEKISLTVAPSRPEPIASGTEPEILISEPTVFVNEPDVLATAAETLGVSVRLIRAIAEVESRGKGFLDSGRPTILFERHVFYRRLAAHGFDPSSLEKDYPWIIASTPGGYQVGELEYHRLHEATKLHARAAYESASWGAFQIMGYHWKTMGYASIDEFVACMREDDDQHLLAFVRLISADRRLHSALRKKDWADFARRYNGPAYAKHAYDVKLAKAYNRLASR